jgi:hypothetical protein
MEVPVDELAETLRMHKFVRDPDDRWFDIPEIELSAIDSPAPRPRSRLHLPLALLGLLGLLALAAMFWT